MASDLKPIEPVTVITDLMLAIEGLVFGALLLYFWIKNEDQRQTHDLMWIGTYFSIMIFAFFGALAHGTDSKTIEALVWPPTMIFGGITFIFLVAGVIIYQKESDYAKLLIIPIVLFIIYLILIIILNWPFILWVLLLIVCSIIIYIYAFKAKSDGKALAPYLINGLTIIIIAGVVQAIGGIIGYQTYFGPNNEYLFTPHNDIFHVIAMIGMYVFYRGFRKASS
ncbi:MAG: hypothetical protein EU539_01145 [Promethearchaeota archaeon]|nr:MAG: hypothetical protein EU539_01145 [Candidatus Lokiarchaeota archaeon]